MRIILSSTSPRRKEILSKINLVFETCPSEYEEDMSLNMDPFLLAKHLSFCKAKSVADRNKDALVIGADTFIVYDNKLLGKPNTSEKAVEMLEMLSGKVHLVLTGLTIINSNNGKVYCDVDETKVYFKSLSKDEIKEYVETGEPLDKAGAYAIQGIAAKFIEKIEGEFFNVMGLPLEKLISILNMEFGVKAKKISLN